MAVSPVREKALVDIGLLVSVVEFKERFYPRGWARYDLAKPGTLKLVPHGRVLASVAADYRAMAHMIFGDYPSFKTVIDLLQGLEDEVSIPHQRWGLSKPWAAKSRHIQKII